MYTDDYDEKMAFAIHCLSKLSLTFFRLSVVKEKKKQFILLLQFTEKNRKV